MSEDVLESIRSISGRLLDIQAAADAAEARNDKSALVVLQDAVSTCLAAARAIGEPGLIALAYQVNARLAVLAGDVASAVVDALQGEAALVDISIGATALAAHPRLEQVLELRKVRIQALAILNDSPALVRLAQDTVLVLEVRRARLHDPFQQAAFLSGRTLFYEMFALASYKLEQWDELLTAMDLLKSRAGYLKPKTSAPPAEDPDLSARLAAANATLASADPASAPYRAAAEQRRLLVSLRAIVRGSNEDQSVDAVARLKITEVQAALAIDEALIAFVWISHEVLIVLSIDAASVHAERIVLSAPVRAELDRYVDELREQRLDPATLDGLVAGLVDALLPSSTREVITRCRRLILSPHRELHVVPFHAARLGERWLIELCAVRYVPTVASVLLPRPAESRTRSLFALGIDTFSVPGERWPVLQQAEGEVAEVAAVWQGRSLPVATLTGPGATVAAWRALGSRFAGFSCLHIATHGASVFDREAKNDPMAARLILQDGALDALALSRMRLSADVVVLSACNSGQRALEGRGLDELPGDDNFGLQAALFEAGARCVIGALWQVVDDVAPLIMRSLHDGLAAGNSVDLALQAALIEYLGRPDARRDIFVWGQMFLSSLV